MTNERKATQKLRWFYPTPGRLLVVLLAVEGILVLSEPWFPKGYAVLIAIASVGVALVLMLLWFVLALLFRCRFQFSIRSLLLLTVVVAVLSSWFTVRMREARRQRETVEAIHKLGAIGYDYQSDSSMRPIPYANPPGPAWMRNLLGDDWFDSVSAVLIVGSQVTDIDLENLKGLNHLKYLTLHETTITDAGLENLTGLQQLQNLQISGSNITDAGLKQLERLKQLKAIYLIYTHVTDAGVAKLQKALPDCKIEN